MDWALFNSHKLPVKIAITEEEQVKGLMWQVNPQPMAFPSDLRPKKFWMANCPVPLDIIFCANNKVIDIQKGVPYSLENVGPSQASDLVIELVGGMANQLGIKIGTEVKLQYSITSLASGYEHFLSQG